MVRPLDLIIIYRFFIFSSSWKGSCKELTWNVI
ncbi:unnamed protein product [Nezara viridula]|uniref:Uncharacterized protein n=1 Tax=Nezara viridula TaxID=85310 RepID=A0A9P0MQH9_NEZVI|nr:unnamed protein product [Nezara viridula]